MGSMGLLQGLSQYSSEQFTFISFCLFFLTARKRNSKETAIALEKLLPKRCQVLGLVTPGIVGRRKMCDSVREQFEGVWCITVLCQVLFITVFSAFESIVLN